MAERSSQRVVVLGAGPAGISAGWRLAERGAEATVLERDTAVGGMGKTLQIKSCPDPSPKGEIKNFKQLIECLAPNRRAVVTVSGTGR